MKQCWTDSDFAFVLSVYLGGCVLSLGFLAAVVWIVAAAVKWVLG